MGRKVRWLVWAGYVVLWTAALLLPSSTIESLADTDMLGSGKYFLAKSLHVLAYAVMTLLAGWLHLSARWRCLLIYFLMGHATLTEILQKYYIPGRTGVLEDVAFDQVGITLGLLLSWKWWVEKGV